MTAPTLLAAANAFVDAQPYMDGEDPRITILRQAAQLRNRDIARQAQVYRSLTRKLRETYRAVLDASESTGASPTMRELAPALGLSRESTATIRDRLIRLHEAGAIHRDPMVSRGIRPLIERAAIEISDHVDRTEARADREAIRQFREAARQGRTA